MRSMHLLLYKHLYKARLGHLKSHCLCKERVKPNILLPLLASQLCGKLWCWLCVCLWLVFSPWMTQRMG